MIPAKRNDFLWPRGRAELPASPRRCTIGAGKYGVTQLANLAALPPTGALFVVAPLKLTGGTGSPVRAFALVPRV